MRQKKNISTFADDLDDPTKEQIIDILKILQSKILASSALNGGFDRLISKVEQIEKGQHDAGAKVTSIYDAIYHPDEGLFARVKIIENKRSDEEKLLDKEIKLHEERDNLLKEHTIKIKELVEYKEKTYGFGKWFLVGISGGGVSLFFKLLYDFISGHVMYH